MADIKMSTLEQDAALDEELAQVLMAISVISGRLAKKITAKYQSKEDTDVKDVRTDGRDRQSEI